MKVNSSLCFFLMLLLCIIAGESSLSQSIIWQKSSVGIGDTAWVSSFAGNSQGHIFAVFPNSGLFRSSDNGSSWVRTSAKPPFSNIIDIAIDSSGWIFVGDLLGVFRSTDNGVSWEKKNVGFIDTLSPEVNRIIVSRNGYIFAASEEMGLYRSINRGDTWQVCASPLQVRTVTSLAIDSWGNLYVGIGPTFGYGGLFVSSNNGDSWTGPIFRGKTIPSVVVNSKGVVFVATQNPPTLYRWTNLGLTWDTLSTNLAVYLLGVNSANRLFGVAPRTPAGIPTAGVFQSTDNGTSWSNASEGLPDTISVVSMFVASNDYVFLGTSYHGIYRSSQKTTSVSMREGVAASFKLLQNYPNPFNPSTTIRFELPTQSFISLKVFDVLGREITTLVEGSHEAGIFSVKFDGSRLVSGVYCYRLQAGNYVETKKLVMLK